MEKINKHPLKSESDIENAEIQSSIKFGVKFEEHRIKDTLSKLEWFKNNGYKPHLPQGIDKNSNNEQIKEHIEKEYDQAEYEKISEKLRDDFSEISGDFQRVLVDIFGENVPTIYDVFLTKYGVGGSYGMPNNVVFNIYNKKGIKTIVHEIVHLMVEENIQKYKLEHFEKERLVDLILNSEKFSFLQYNSWQKDYHGAEKYVDDLFNEHFFESQEKFFDEMENTRKKYPEIK